VTSAPGPDAPGAPAGPGPKPLTVSGLLLLDPHGYYPTLIDSVVVDDRGIGVVRRRGEAPRLLPWTAVVAHAVEPWGGGVVPGWWVDAEGTRPDGPVAVPDGPPDALSTLPAAAGTSSAGRRLPHAEPGALLSVQTRSGTYRFLRAGGDPAELARRIGAFAVRHNGPSGLSTVTTVAPRRLRRPHRAGWARVQPLLVVLLVVVVAVAVTLILLQSAGVVHLPFLGGGASSSPGAGGAARSGAT
jgi:hypothetical protein